ncbi:hypothetical protein JCM16303_004345 [Sporobolomyces ruberrimus]
MDRRINMSTSDDSPVVLSVSRIALIANSRVFADMLAVGNDSEGTDDSIPLAETEEELKVFVYILEGRDEEAQKTLRRYSDGQWEKLANLADKYDCMVLRKVVETKAWSVLYGSARSVDCTDLTYNVVRQIEAENGSSAFAFTLATLTGDEHLIRTTAKRAVLIRNLNHEDFHAAAVWKERLVCSFQFLSLTKLNSIARNLQKAWRTVHNSTCFDKIRNTLATLGPISTDTCRHSSPQDNPGREWFADAVWSSFDICKSPSLSLDKFCDISNVCICHDYLDVARQLQQSLSEWPEFAVAGMYFGTSLTLISFSNGGYV